MLLHLRGTLSILFLLCIYGCASGSKLASIEPVSKDIPPDLRAKFEVLEKTPAAPSVIKNELETKGKSKKKTGLRSPKPIPLFNYPNRRIKNDPIWVGERQVLEFTYLGLAAGEFTMDVLPYKQIGNRSVYHISGRAESSSVLNLFYSLNDTIESFIDYEGLFSHRFHLLLDETKQKRDALELFDSEAKKVFYWNRRNHVDRGSSETKETFDMVSFPQDSFSGIYYVRTLPLETGKVYTFPVVSEGQGWDCIVTVVSREMLDTPLGRKQTILLKLQTSFKGVLKQEGSENFIWLTDDERRFIARMEAKVKIGSVAARLKSVEFGVKPSE